jgi:D-alanyl-D-alanine carboxypeptidase (penicillin-binding protein 5/6)
VAAPADERVRIHFHKPPRAGLLWNVRTGRVLWSRNADRRLPIASLTKMMTAIEVVRDGASPHDRVLITREALAYQGSGVGLLPRGHRVPLEPLLYGLLLPSGNDAAIALAQHVGGQVRDFVADMNFTARRLGLRCSRFSSPDGFHDQGNHACARDLARLARAVLRTPRLARIVGTRHALLRFPIKGGHLDVYNNNGLMRLGYRGTDGIKTGYTDAAGRCLVATAHRRGVRLGVVLLHADDPPGQARKLLDLGFRQVGA